MYKGFAAAFLLGTCACGRSATPQGAGSPGPDLSTATAALRQNLLIVHATLDGAPVTDLKPVGRCEAVFMTAGGPVPVRWRELGNLAPRLNGDQTLFSIPAGGRRHVLSARTGKVATRIDMGLGLLDGECGAS